MNKSFSEIGFESDLEELSSFEDFQRWKIERAGPLKLYVTLSSKNNSNDDFQAVLSWDKYPDEPPSLKFRDPKSGRLDCPSAWPKAQGFRPTSFDACVNWCSEGFKIHPEWKNDKRFRWSTKGNVLAKVIGLLQLTLDTSYSGRYQ